MFNEQKNKRFFFFNFYTFLHKKITFSTKNPLQHKIDRTLSILMNIKQTTKDQFRTKSMSSNLKARKYILKLLF